MRFKELIDSLTWSEIKIQLLLEYPDSEESVEAYHEVFNTLNGLKEKETEMRIIVRETFRQEIDDAPFTGVIGRDGTLNKELPDFEHFKDKADSEYANSEVDYAIAMTPWEEWMGMEIDPGTMSHYTGSQIVAHCLWEMTFHGFTQDSVQERKDELQRRIDELEAMTEEEKKEKLIPWEEVKKKLENQLKKFNGN
jgi:hypothetical protein